MKLNFRAYPLQEKTDGGTGGGTDAAAVAAAAAAAAGKTGENETIAGGTGTEASGKKPAEGAAGGTGTESTEGAGSKTGGKAGETTTPKAPAKYELSIPEGGRLDESDLKHVEAAARAADMTNEEAQAWITEQDTAIKAQSDRFLEETKADPDLGGEKLEESTRLARAGIDRIFPKGDKHREGFLKFLNRGGAGNNVHVVRALARIGKLSAEDTAVGGQGGTGNSDPASKLYDKT